MCAEENTFWNHLVECRPFTQIEKIYNNNYCNYQAKKNSKTSCAFLKWTCSEIMQPLRNMMFKCGAKSLIKIESYPRDKFISCEKVLMNSNYQPVKTRPPTLQRNVAPSPLSLTGQKFCVCKATFDQETQYGDIQCDLCQQVRNFLPWCQVT